MKYTKLYLKLVDAVCEMNYQLAFNHDKIETIKPKLDALSKLAEYVRSNEIRVGNAEEQVLNVEFTLDTHAKKSFLFELNAIVEAAQSLIQIYSTEDSFSAALQDGSLSQANTTLGETDVVPISEGNITEDIAEYINNNIARFLRYTEQYTQEDLKANVFLNSILPELVSDISLEITEITRPKVYKQLLDIEAFDDRLKLLGLTNHLVGTFIEDFSAELTDGVAESLIKEIMGQAETNQLVKKSNLF